MVEKAAKKVIKSSIFAKWIEKKRQISIIYGVVEKRQILGKKVREWVRLVSTEK